MHKKLSLGINLALAGNLLFILFAVFWYWFYKIYDPNSGFVSLLEKVTYVTLFAGFICLAAADVLFWRTIRMRTAVKVVFALYIAMEAFMMYCELNSYEVMSFYKPYSMKLAILHAILSAAACFIFVYLDPYKTQFEVTVIICIGLILGGMFGNLIGIRVYFSILMNAIAFSALFFAIRYMVRKEIIEIDCYGDKARVAEYKSVFFEEEVDDDEDAEDGTDEAPEPEKPEMKPEPKAQESLAEKKAPTRETQSGKKAPEKQPGKPSAPKKKNRSNKK